MFHPVQRIGQVEVEADDYDRHYPRLDDHGEDQEGVENEPAFRRVAFGG